MIRRIFGFGAVLLATRVGAQAAWTLGSRPLIEIGSDGTPNTEFSRVDGVMRLSGGRTAVVNTATKQIRIFGERGEFLKSFGRSGEGPGEFRNVNTVGRAGDTVYLYDHSLKRITVALLADEPRVLNTIPFRATSDRGFFSVQGRLTDGRWVVVTWISPGWDGPKGTYRMKNSIGLASPDATGAISWLVELPGTAVFVDNPTGNLKDAVVGVVGFSPNVVFTANGPVVVFADNAADSIAFQAGDRRTMVRVPMQKRTITPAMADAARDRELDAMPASATDKGKRFTRARYDLRQLYKELPTFSALRAGIDGETWIEEYTATKQEARRYLVLNAAGAPKAWVSAPSGFQVLEVGRDYVAGIQTDSDDVEWVRVYPLRR